MDMLGDIISVVGFFLGILYSAGLVIVTIHLSRYGVTTVYLLRTKYLIAGSAYFLHVLGMGILLAPVAIALTLLLGLNTSAYIVWPVSAFGVFFLLFSGYFPSFFRRTVRPFFADRFPNWSNNIDWYIWYSAVYCSFLLPWHSLIRSFVVDDANVRTMGILLSVFVFLSGIVYYTLFLYQNPISTGDLSLELIGGGRPIPVRLTVDNKAISTLQKYGLFTPDADTSEPVFLLDEVEKYFLVLVDLDGKERALRISKEIVYSVVYLP